MNADDQFSLAVAGIRKSFGGVEVLHGVDLDVAGGSVLALLGENGAGKSTLVKIVAGDYQPDAGSVTIGSEEFDGLTPIAARSHGVRMIFQELADAPTLSVAENISLGQWPGTHGFVSWSKLRRTAQEALDQLKVDLDPGVPVDSLSVGERQVVEIARALTNRARCLILDEPTAALSGPETERLFRYVRALRESGTALIYITHRLDEVREIADRVAILRDGKIVLNGPAGDFERRELVSAMVGRSISEVQRPADAGRRQSGPDANGQSVPIVRFKKATSHGAFDEVDLEVFPGEVVALYGKIGSGSAEVSQAAFGIRSIDSGTIELDGEQVNFKNPAEAIHAGVGLLPADRQREGTFMVRSVAENISAPSWGKLSHLGFLNSRSEGEVYQHWHDILRIRSRNDPGQELSTLSGGNQQKIVLGRWLERGSRLLLLVEPTRGVDVGARQEIYASIRDLAAGGIGVLVSTTDYEEVVQLADRAIVMDRGRVVARLDADEINTRRLTEEVGG